MAPARRAPRPATLLVIIAVRYKLLLFIYHACSVANFRVAGPCHRDADSECISCGSLQNPSVSALKNASSINNTLLSNVWNAVGGAVVKRWLPWKPSYANVTQMTLLRTTGAMCDSGYVPRHLLGHLRHCTYSLKSQDQVLLGLSEQLRVDRRSYWKAPSQPLFEIVATTTCMHTVRLSLPWRTKHVGAVLSVERQR